MRQRPLLIILAMVGLAVLILLVVTTLQAPPTQTTAQAKPQNVVIAANPIPVGTLIKPQDLAFGTPAADALPAATFDRVYADRAEDQAALDDKTRGEVVGAVARHRVEAGEPIPRGAVVKPGDSGFLAAVLRPGMRAITVGVTAVSGAGGLIYPGDRVDVILTQTFNGDMSIARRSVGETVADDLRVLAIDQQLQVKEAPQGEGKIARTVTLEVEPRQAEKIALAVKLGELSLTIRSLESGTGPQTAGTTDSGATTISPTGTPPAASSATAGATPPGAGDNTQTAEAPPTWAEDVSPALKLTAKAAQKDQTNKAQKPPVLVIRGDKTDEVGVH